MDKPNPEVPVIPQILGDLALGYGPGFEYPPDGVAVGEVSPVDVRRVDGELEFRYVPERRSWLDMAELGSACWPVPGPAG